MNAIHPTDSGAIVYHDGINIRGISFVSDPVMDALEKFYISKVSAEKFFTGEEDTRNWIIWRSNETYSLYKKTSSNVQFSSIDDIPCLIPEISDAWFMIKIYDGFLVFNVETPMTFITKEMKLNFIITSKDDPSAVISVLSIPCEEILNGPYIVKFENTLIDIYTHRLFESYGVMRCYEKVIALPLPKKHFIDIMRFTSGTIKDGLQATWNRSEGVLRLEVHGHVTVLYNRPTAFLRLLFSAPNDPSLILHTETIDLVDIDKGIDIKLPLMEMFDLWSPLIYYNAALEITSTEAAF